MSAKAWLIGFEMKGNDLSWFFRFLRWAEKEAHDGSFLGVNYIFFSNKKVAGFEELFEPLILAFTTEGTIIMDRLREEDMVLYMDTKRLDNLAVEHRLWHDHEFFERWCLKNCKAFESVEQIEAWVKSRIVAKSVLGK